jgi:hypothetical protein
MLMGMVLLKMQRKHSSISFVLLKKAKDLLKTLSLIAT